DLADAFEAYDDALLSAYGEMTPLEVYGEDDDDLEFDDDEDDEEDDDEKDDEDAWAHGADGHQGADDDGEIDDHADEDDDEATYSGFEGDFEFEGVDRGEPDTAGEGEPKA
ncbi:MAG: hypothetical protein ABI131_02365, partial [Nostocoides sp.]